MDLFHILYGPVRRLHHVRRFSAVPLVKDENVAEHSWQVAFISYLIGTDLNSRIADEDTSMGFKPVPFINMERLLTRALVHDVSEALSGDVIRSFKYSSPAVAQSMRDADRANMNRLTEGWGSVSADAFHSWLESKEGTPEGAIVAFADVITVVLKCAEEYHLGNRMMDEVLRRAYDEYLCGVVTGQGAFLKPYLEQVFPNGHYRDVYRQAPRVSEGDYEEGTHNG